MKPYSKYSRFLCMALFAFSGTALAASSLSDDSVDERVNQEEKQIKNPFLVSLYKPTYVLPFYYTQSPYPAFYRGTTIPGNQTLQKTEFNFQISFKVPILRNLWGRESSLYAAYTQLSFWQAYNKSAFFRASNYEPELFLANHINKPLFGGWRAKFLNVGLVHQSNGAGGPQERTWNRVYVETILANKNLMARVKIWQPIRDNGLRKYNPDITRYLGYSELQLAYKINKNVFSIESRNHLESGFRRGAAKITWSFPLLENVKGYVQAFSGYGQSLNEYNHRTNSVGVGLTLNDVI